ncbi:MAG TPA: DUF1638 domain-containing protein [Methanotrichaceae archaeon]|nr:DUF1638 domain-containing protein [Methanotrichaceae archaeon]
MLGIIACGMLEDELAHVLCSDSGVRHLLLIDSPEILGLARKLRSRNRSHLVVSQEAIPDLLADIMKGRSNGFLTRFMDNMDKIGLAFFGRVQQNRGPELTVVVSLLKKALHSDEKLLREEVYRSIVDHASFSDGILLFFGLCGNALTDIEVDFKNLPCPLHFLADGEGKRIDDCIAATFGGNREYAEALSSFPGVGIFFTPMWAYHWQEIDREVRMSSKSKGLGRMLKDLGYSKVARLDTGLEFISNFEIESKINDFARLYSLEVIHLHGGTKVVERCYRQARENLMDRRTMKIDEAEKASGALPEAL